MIQNDYGCNRCIYKDQFYYPFKHDTIECSQYRKFWTEEIYAEYLLTKHIDLVWKILI